MWGREKKNNSVLIFPSSLCTTYSSTLVHTLSLKIPQDWSYAPSHRRMLLSLVRIKRFYFFYSFYNGILEETKKIGSKSNNSTEKKQALCSWNTGKGACHCLRPIAW